MLRRTFVIFVAVIGGVGLLSQAAAAAGQEGEQEATYGDQIIELDDGSWDGAQACAVAGAEVRCFSTESEMNAWLTAAAGETAAPSSGGIGGLAAIVQMAAVAAPSCSSTLRLYEHGGFGGRILYFSSRAQWFNLSDFGFSNRVSSFRVGACSSYLADYNNGGGSWYPGSSAWVSVGVMPSWWNDRISSIYLV
jgi:hypothetical protein